MFEVPSSTAGEAKNRFKFKIGDESYDVPHMEFLTGEQVDAIAEADLRGGIHDVAASYAMFGPADSVVGKAVRTLDQVQLDALIAAYQVASGVNVGESSASTDS